MKSQIDISQLNPNSKFLDTKEYIYGKITRLESKTTRKRDYF